MALIDLIRDKYKIVSIIGMAKNAGKTVTLNYLIDEASKKDITIGITSTGRDGEAVDLVTGTEKPAIYVYEGTYIATCEKVIGLGDAKVEIIKATDFRSPMGRIIIGKVRRSGYAQIGGPQTAKEVHIISSMLKDLGADVVFIDGALNRISSAAPSVSKGCILATGAVVSRDMNKVIRETMHTIEMLRLPEVKEKTLRMLINDIFNLGKVSIVECNLNVKALDIKTALNGGRVIGENITDNTRYIVFPGSLVGRTLKDIISYAKDLSDVTFIVKDGTKIFVSSKDWIDFTRQGINVRTLNSINTLALTINPYSPQGYYFNQGEFLSKMKAFIKDIPVVDVVHGGEDFEWLLR